MLPVMVLLRDGGTSSAGIGLALAGEAVGALAGAVLVSRLHRLAGPGVLLLVVAWTAVPVTLAPLLPGGVATVFAALFVVGIGVPALRVMLDLLVFQQVPDEPPRPGDRGDHDAADRGHAGRDARQRPAAGPPLPRRRAGRDQRPARGRPAARDREPYAAPRRLAGAAGSGGPPLTVAHPRGCTPHAAASATG